MGALLVREAKAALVACVLQAQLALSAVSVLSHQTGHLVLRLRDHVVIDERELVARRRPHSSCSSMSGPVCPKLAPDSGEAEGLVDGVLSQHLRLAHPEAFRWDWASDQKVATAVSKLIQDLTAGSSQAGLVNLTLGHESFAGAQKRPSSRSRCFELALGRLPPSQRFGQSVPADFSRGFPTDLKVSWDGVWRVVACPYPADPATSLYFGEAPLRHGLCLRAGSSRLRLSRPAVVRRFVVGIDAISRKPEDCQDGFVCGLLKGRERWCRRLEQVAMDARASKAHGAGRGMFYSDVGNSLLAVDEVSLFNMPSTGLVVASIALSTAPSQKESAEDRQVVLLHRPMEEQKISPRPPGLFEGTLETISSDAAVWNADEILSHGLRLSRRVTFVDQLTQRSSGELKHSLPSAQEGIEKEAAVVEPTATYAALQEQLVEAFAELAQKLADPGTEVLAGSVVYEDLNTEKVGELAEDLASKMTQKLEEPAESPKVLQAQLKQQFAEALGILFQQGQENAEDRVSDFGA
ncbi:unnamed protein product [Symbiodinium sp. CCMP2456]|nr:unnamed protein product [Symbiodinium sp. CCMP2456]